MTAAPHTPSKARRPHAFINRISKTKVELPAVPRVVEIKPSKCVKIAWGCRLPAHHPDQHLIAELYVCDVALQMDAGSFCDRAWWRAAGPSAQRTPDAGNAILVNSQRQPDTNVHWQYSKDIPGWLGQQLLLLVLPMGLSVQETDGLEGEVRLQGIPWNCIRIELGMLCTDRLRSSQRYSSRWFLGLFQPLGYFCLKVKTANSAAGCPAAFNPWHRDRAVAICMNNHFRAGAWVSTA